MKLTTVLLEWNVLSGQALLNRAHIVRRTSLRQYIMLMKRCYMALDGVRKDHYTRQNKRVY